MLRFLDAGESHGKGMVTIIEGIPYGLKIRAEDIEEELSRRRLGYGRGARMKLERDEVEILSGIRLGKTLGSPLAMMVRNAEYGKWSETMGIDGGEGREKLTRPRPGHADIAGALKYGTKDIRDILERASARETVGRVCAGAVAKVMLREMDMQVWSHVIRIGGVSYETGGRTPNMKEVEKADEDELRCLRGSVSRRMIDEINSAGKSGDSLGGTFEVLAYGLPAGLGSHVHWDKRLDSRLAASVMAIQAIKGVEIGDGFNLAGMRGSGAVDIIRHEDGRGFFRLSNHAGGIEGGITNGETLVLRAAMKPIPTMARAVESVDIESKERVEAATERADVCAVPAAAVIAESVVALVIADALMEKLGGDRMEEINLAFKKMKAEQAKF
ncbi:MAG: chorismate synthase [Actinomycetota bacterium]|nr:chorismate synthase [Actinomycetota bacterium]